MIEKPPKSSTSPLFFPSQKKTDNQKSDKWAKECIEAGIGIADWEHENGLRSSRKNKQINLDLYNDILDPKDVERIINPFKIQDASFPATYQNYPLANAILNTLTGEERKRIFNPSVTVINHDAINQKTKFLNDQLIDFAVRNVLDKNSDPEKIQAELKDLEKWKRYTYQDRRERMASQILNYLFISLDLKEMFSRGFEDLLIVTEGIYSTDIIGDEPVARKLNPVHISSIRSGGSYKIEDSEIIIEDGYKPIGQIIDDYYEYLKSSEIDKIEAGNRINVSARKGLFGDSAINQDYDLTSFIEQEGLGEIITANARGRNSFGGTYDAEGNIRTTRVLWKSMRKIGILTFYDELGELQKKMVPENYKRNIEKGEQVKWTWISEWWEGTRIGDDIYVKIQPRPIQFRHMDNLSICRPGIVGTIINVNESPAKSLMDLMKPYQYLYNIFMYRTELAFAKYKGKIGRLNIAEIPDGWNMDQWMYYAETLGWAVYDPFSEGTKGASQGKLAGQMSGQNTLIDLEMGNYIQQHISMMEYIERRLGDISGVTPQRKGSIDFRETKGGVERAVQQSSHNTEKYYSIHDNTKIRVLRDLLDTAKVAWKDKKFKRSYILDDGSTAILDFDGTEFCEAEYGVAVTSSSSDMEMLQTIKSLSQALIQNGGKISTVIDIYRTKDIASLHRKIQEAEEELRAEQAQAQQAQVEANTMVQQEKNAIESRKIDVDERNNIRDNMTKLQTSGADDDSIEQAKLRLEEEQAELDKKIKEGTLQEKIRSNKINEEIKRKSLTIKKNNPGK